MIEIAGLTKKYGKRTVLENVSFTCRPGTVTGFLGPNGAGKSTTMRILSGLTPPTGGRATINGHRFADLPNPAWQVGILLDASAQHAGRTGREVMELAARVLGADPAGVPKLLERVGLSAEAGERRIGGYSLGMRQRLGLAHALIGDPTVLVLDEPANGLDPEGIHWMRYLLREFAEGGGTVLLSSHLLREVEAVADRLVVIAGGRILADGTRDELLSNTGTRVRAADRGLLRQALERAGIETTATSDGALLTQADAAAVGLAAAAVGVPLIELRPADEDGLERLFLTLTGANGSEIVK